MNTQTKGKQMEVSALIFSVLAFLFSVINLVELRAQKLSTHQVQFVDPLKDYESQIEKINKDQKEEDEFQNII